VEKIFIQAAFIPAVCNPTASKGLMKGGVGKTYLSGELKAWPSNN